MEFYEHSGRFGLLSIVTVSIAGVIADAVGGLVYSYVINYIPLIYLSFLATIAFGALIGVAVDLGARNGKIRNTLLVTLLGGFFGLVGMYFAWAFDAMARDVVNRPLWNPQILWEYMQIGFQQGFWGIGEKGDAVKGWFLVSIWLAEAGIVVGTAALLARTLHSNRLFCEETEQWLTPEKDVARLSLVGDEAAESKLKRLLDGDLNVLSEFSRAAEDDGAYLQFDVATCPECPNCNFVTATMIHHEVNKKGEVSKQETKLLANLKVTPSDVASVRAAGVDRLVGQAAAPEPPPESEPVDDTPRFQV